MMLRTLRVLWLSNIIALAAMLPAAAHPLGNFTINHLTKIEPAGQRLEVRYVLDMAEIPTFALMRERNASGRMSAAQLQTWANDEMHTVSPQLDLRIDGAPARLISDRASARTRPGAGGLPLLYFVAGFHTALAPGAHAVTYTDQTFDGRLGWKDVVVGKQREPTHELLAYPPALLGSPRNTTAVAGTLSADHLRFTSSNTAPDAATANAAPPPSAVRSNQLSDMLARGTREPLFVLLTLLVAIALGALHALEPGHGKTLLAVSLVGSRATVPQAAILAGSLTVAHTIGVLALGVAIIALKGYFVPEAVYPWITLVSGIVIAVIGARAVARAVMAHQPFAHSHPHGHTHAHDHDHDHVHHPDEHEHPHGHTHAPAGSAPLRFGPTVWAAMSGGVAPCPAALVVLFAAIAQNVLVYGIIVIVFFSFGLAATLTGLGIGVVRGAGWVSQRPALDRFVKYGPLLSAIVIACIGAVMVGQGFVQQGIPISASVVTALVALAIAGYAFSHPLHHARSVQTV
jgi:nickel/cobalt transporter (NicO) family protein